MLIPPEAEQDAELIDSGEYDMPMASPPATVLDIGGNVGLFSRWAAKQWPEATITAYEPDAENAARFRQNVTSRNVVLIEAGVRRESGAARLYEGRNVMCRTFHAEHDESGKSTQATTCAASAIASAEFVKIDTEGDEVEILSGLDTDSTRALVIEYHTDDAYKALRGIAFARGFHLHAHTQYRPGLGLLKFTRLLPEKKLFVGACIDNGAKHQWYRAMERLADDPPCEMVQFDVVGDSLVSRARNSITAAFIKSDCSHLMFIDSDIIFQPGDVARLLAHDKGIVAGFYPLKQQSLGWVCNALEGGSPIGADGLQRMRYMGTGFMLIARWVFDRMRAELPIEFTPDDRQMEREWDFWPAGIYQFPETRRYLSEDWMFCQRALDLGIDVFADTRVVVQHVGEVVFPLESERSKYIVKK